MTNFGIIGQWVPINQQTLHSISNVIYYSPGCDDKTQFLKTLQRWVIEYGKNQVVMESYLHLSWLCYVSLEEKSKYESHPAIHFVEHWPEKTCNLAYNSDTKIMEVSIFWLHLRYEIIPDTR